MLPGSLLDPHLDMRGGPILGGWLPGETLFSLCSRHHHLTGNPTPARTSLQLFGHARCTPHDFPLHLDQFCRNTGQRLGTAEHIALQHTILPYFLRHRSKADSAFALSAVRGGAGSPLKAQLGLLAMRFGAAHPLKACRTCMERDTAAHGVPYWHLEHQWPGTWVCLVHDRPLSWSAEKVNGSYRFHWLLPADCTLRDALPSACNLTSRDRLRGLARCAASLSTLPHTFHFDPAVLLRTYRLGIATAFGTRNSRIPSEAFSRRILEVTQPLRVAQELSALPSTEAQANSQFTRLIRPPRSSAHPIRHFVLAMALFGDWDSFLEVYDTQSSMDSEERHEAPADSLRASPDDPRRAAVRRLVAGGATVSAAARGAGVSVATAMAWLAAHGCATRRRPSKLLPAQRRKAVEMLRSGAPKASAAQRAGVSVSSINLLIRTEPGLQHARQQALLEHRRRQARALWERAGARLPGATQTQLRRLHPGTYAWLYRNDRDWVEAYHERRERVPPSNNACVRWDERDRELAAAVRLAALDLHTPPRASPVKLSELCDRVPSLKARLGHLDQLPLTRHALQIARRPTGAHTLPI